MIPEVIAAPAAAQQAPQVFATSDGQPYKPNFSNLAEDKIRELNSVISAMNKRDLWARQLEIIRTTLRRYFWLGIQHGFWNPDTQQLQVGANGAAQAENLDQEDLFQGDFNIYTQNGKIFMSVFSQNAAGTRAEPDNPGNGDSAKAAAEAEKYIKVYEKYNSPKVMQMAAAELMWTDGRIVAVTETQADEDRLGMAPESADGEPTPRVAELTELFGVLETKVPAVGKFSEWPYCKVSREIDVLMAQHQNPDFAEKIKTNSEGTAPNDLIARLSRIAVSENIMGLSSDTLDTLATEDRYWLRPAAFRYLPKDKQDFWIGDAGIFKQGCRVKMFGQSFCGAKAVSMNAEVAVMHAMPGKGNMRPSLSDPMIPIQMEYNDAVGMYSELLHKSIGRTWINCGVEEMAAIDEQLARYGEYSPASFASGQPMENFFFQEQPQQMPEGFEPWMENLQGPLSQFVTGNSPALFGQQMEDQKTASGYAQARDQSLGLMAIVWVPYLHFKATICGQAARQAGDRDEDEISAVIADDKGKDQVISIDAAMLQRGFITSPIIDQNFPESWTETSNTWKSMLAAAPTNPLIAKQFTIPDNLVALKDAIGLKNMKIDGADQRNVQLDEWTEIQAGDGPIPDPDATQARDQQRQQAVDQAAKTLGAAGAQALPPLPQLPQVMTSSVAISINADDHIVHALTMFDLLSTPEGRKVKKNNLDVWKDGELHMLEHIAAAKAKGLIIPPPIGNGLPALPGLPGTPAGPTPGAGAGPAPGAPPNLPPPGETPNAGATASPTV